MDPNLTPPSSLVPEDALTPANTLSRHDKSSAPRPTSLAVANALSKELKQLFPAIDLGVSNVNHLEETSLQIPILKEIIRRMGLAGQLRRDSESSVPIVPPNIPLVDKAAAVSDAYDYTLPTDSPSNTSRPFSVISVPIKTEPRHISGSGCFSSGSSPSGRSSSPEETSKKRLLNKQRSLKNKKKKWILGTDWSLSRNSERLIKEKKVQRKNIKTELVDQECGQSEKEWESPKIEDSPNTDMTSTGSLHADDALPKSRRDVDVLRHALLTGIEKNVDDILASYLQSQDADEMFGNSQEDNNGFGDTGSRVRVRIKGNEVTVGKELDLRPFVREHFRTLLFLNNDTARVPWKNLGIWLYSQKKRLIKWDRVIPTDFAVRGPVYYHLNKEQHRKMLLVDLEDWTEDEIKERRNSEIPLIFDPKNRVLVKVGDLCEMYPGKFINAMATGSKKRRGKGPTVITMAGTSYTTSSRSQMKGKRRMTSSTRDDSEFDSQ